MTEQPAGGPNPGTDDEEQDLAWSPAKYAPLDPAKPGRWATVDGTAIVWTDGVDGAGIAWLKNTDLVQQLWQHFQVAKQAGTTAGVAYELALRQAAGAATPEEQGPLVGATEDFDALMAASGKMAPDEEAAGDA